ncbi:chemotaxis protein CheA [Clostridium peptidivorans]|uniref:chemotaxis protein CheA n=1 Tax=Clostridium peptidivorans TaxID=100174 RepID=UPI000BE337E1|nr:chemotaxis protein CheA [Clostridium peptidivorans]
MDTSQYMSMFLEESMDNLQTLNESLLQLEQGPEDLDKVNEIFRVAHTIKGMAATMGFNQMAELTHKMEDVLAEFRNGELKVTEKVVTVLFKCLDTLERMVNNISEDIEEAVFIDDIMNELQHIKEKEIEDELSEEVNKSEGNSEFALNDKLNIELNEYDIDVIKAAMEKGYIAYHIKVVLSENTLLKSARAFLIFKSLEDAGEVIKSLPGAEDIENENFEFEFDVIYISSSSQEDIYNAIMSISEVNNVIIQEVNLQKEKARKIEEDTKVSEVVKEKAIEVKDTKVKENVKENASAKNSVSNNKEATHKKQHQSVRVDLERLDKFMNMVSELVIHRTRLEQISLNYKLVELNETLEQVARTTSDLQDLVMKIRMLPLDVVFNRFPRMIRDLSVELNKDMELIIEGQDTELDRTVIDEIGEPLIHLIRNAADHGVESREERIKKGKDPVGKIKLVAYQEGTKAVIKVEDNGGGINVDKVREKAERIGVNTEGMSEYDIINLIFLQGFSTNEEVTDISGRGVGMDVVKTKISSLGGTVEVVSEKNKGSAFIIKLPLTLQIIQALLVKIGTETMAISLGYIDRVIDFNENLVKSTNSKEVIIYNEDVIPLIRLNKKLHLNESDNSKKYIVIVKVGEKNVGLMVDSLFGQQEIVIKPLGKTLHGMKEYIGATILGDGLVTLILDVAALV